MSTFPVIPPLRRLVAALRRQPGPPPEPPEWDVQASELRLRLALKAGGLGVFEHNLSNNLLSTSPEFCQILGLPLQTTITHQAWIERMHPEDRNQVLAAVRRMLDKQITLDLEYRLNLPPPGGVRWIHAMAAPVVINGTVERVYGVVQEITKRKQAQLDLHLFSHAVEQSPVSVVITDLRGDIEYVNPKFCAVTGYSFEEVRGKNPRVLKSGEMPAEGYAQLWHTITAGGEWRGEFHNRKKNGELFWETASIAPIRDAAGKTTHFIAIKEDITLRRTLEESRKEQLAMRDWLAKIATNMPGVIFSFRMRPDGSSCFPYVSPTIVELCGVRAEEITTDGTPLFNVVHPDHLASLKDSIAKSAQTLLPWRLEFQGGSAKAGWIWIEGHATPEREADGGILAHGFMSDVTERKQAEAVLREFKEGEERARQELEREQALNAIKSRFVSLVSHEFRTPLSAINMAAFLLSDYAEGMPPEELVGHAREIQHAVGRMTGMMEDLLIHDKVQTGKLGCKPAWLNIETFCHDLIPEVVKPLSPNHVVALTLDPALREAFVDEKILRHILGNLLSNAVKYSSDDQPVKIELKRVADPAGNPGAPQIPEGDHMELRVTDTGIGIPEADLAKLYQTFHRAANVGNRPGTGMGLAIVKQFVELHKGTIRLESKEGKGTSVRVWLPIGAARSRTNEPANSK